MSTYAATNKWRTANKEKVAAYQREYRRKNPEKMKAADKRKYQNNAEKIKEKERIKRTLPEYKDRKRQSVFSVMVCNARKNASNKNVPFDIDRQYIESIWPSDNCCPIFKIPFETAKIGGTRCSSPSLDRKIPALGYVKNNVHIISMKANRIKNNATIEEIYKVADYFKNLSSIC